MSSLSIRVSICMSFFVVGFSMSCFVEIRRLPPPRTILEGCDLPDPGIERYSNLKA